MAIYAIIQNNIVSNTILAEEDVIDTLQLDADHVVNIDTVDPKPSIGWAFDPTEQTFTAPE